jgi:hypothetical protein
MNQRPWGELSREQEQIPAAREFFCCPSTLFDHLGSRMSRYRELWRALQNRGSRSSPLGRARNPSPRIREWLDELVAPNCWGTSVAKSRPRPPAVRTSPCRSSSCVRQPRSRHSSDRSSSSRRPRRPRLRPNSVGRRRIARRSSSDDRGSSCAPWTRGLADSSCRSFVTWAAASRVRCRLSTATPRMCRTRR